MLRHWIAAAVAFVSASAASAQTPVDWSGFYVGAHGGGDWRSTRLGDSTDAVQNASGAFVANRGIIIVPGFNLDFAGDSDRASGAVWGGQLGLNVQSGSWVFGIEGDVGSHSGTSTTQFGPNVISATALTPGPTNGTSTGSTDPFTPAFVTISGTREVNWNLDWSARARLGYAWGHVMIYGTGGVAGARATVRFTDTWSDLPGGFAAPNSLIGNPPACFFGPAFNPGACPGTANLGPLGPNVTTGSQRRMQIGWTAGIGAEMQLLRGVSAGIEFRRTDLGGKTFAALNGTMSIATTAGSGAVPTPGLASAGPTSMRMTDNAVTVRLNWRFWRLFH